MHIPVISIGNFRGIYLTKKIIEKYNITDTVELILEKGYIILKPKARSEKAGQNHLRKCMKMGMINC